MFTLLLVWVLKTFIYTMYLVVSILLVPGSFENHFVPRLSRYLCKLNSTIQACYIVCNGHLNFLVLRVLLTVEPFLLGL